LRGGYRRGVVDPPVRGGVVVAVAGGLA
jgi:hypothetical protein